MIMNNPPTPHRSNTLPQATPSTHLKTSGIQQNPVPQTLEVKVEQLLAKARSPIRDDEVREVAELLEGMLSTRHPISLRARRQCFRGLVKLCGERGILPSSYLIPESKVEKLGDGPISTGGFSDVWPGMYEDEICVAIKVIRCYETDNAQKIRKNFCREVITWKRLSHPNILELLGVTMDNKECAMVSPWMECGNIVDYVREEFQANPLKLLEDAALGLQYLHSVELAHGDLKGANILISEDGRALLTDVGLMRVAGDLSSNTVTTNTSTTDGGYTVRWSAPELLDPERFGFKRGGPTKKSDIYSMGMTVYEVLTGRVPFWEYRELVVMLIIGDGVRPKKPNFVISRGYTEELWEMTTSCWKEKPTERPNVGEVLEVLKIAAEHWEPQNGVDWSPTLCAESDLHALSEPEDEHFATDASNSLHNSPVTKTVIPTMAPSTFALPSPVSPPSIRKNEASQMSPGHIPFTSDEEKSLSLLEDLSRDEDPERTRPVTPTEEELDRMFVGPSSQEEPKLIPGAVVPVSGEGTWSDSVESSGREGRPPMSSRTQEVSAELYPQLEPTSTVFRKDKTNEIAPVEPIPPVLKTAHSTSIRSLEVPSGPVPEPPPNEAARSVSTGLRKEELSSCATPLREGGSDQASNKQSKELRTQAPEERRARVSSNLPLRRPQEVGLFKQGAGAA